MEPEPDYPCGGDHDGVVVAVQRFAHSRLDVAAQRGDPQVGTDREQLRCPPNAAGADASPLGQRGEVGILARDQHLPRIGALADRRDHQPARRVRGQVFEGVDGGVEPSVAQRFLDIARENTAVAETGER